jgi:hypothetical protein
LSVDMDIITKLGRKDDAKFEVSRESKDYGIISNYCSWPLGHLKIKSLLRLQLGCTTLLILGKIGMIICLITSTALKSIVEDRA